MKPIDLLCAFLKYFLITLGIIFLILLIVLWRFASGLKLGNLMKLNGTVKPYNK